MFIVLLKLPFLLTSNMLVSDNFLYIATGPQLIKYDLINQTSRNYYYFDRCGSFECFPFCVGKLRDSIILGTSGGLLSLSNSTFNVISNKPVTWCEDVITVSEIYRDMRNVITYGEALDENLKTIYKGCAVYTASGDYYSLVCNDTYYLRTPYGSIKIDSPALITRSNEYVGVLTLSGRVMIFRGNEIAYQGQLPTPTPPYFINASNGEFLLTGGGRVYLWKDGKLYASNLTNVLQAVWYGNNLLVMQLSNNELIIGLVKDVEWRAVGKKVTNQP
ncbi:hypothetical protein EYM_00510 [Ignicoccus islandicus DSM 13165]|uniref:Uncharacterized protein n=1 Tax=Ignicoccus islandicus DSM 13165 TaxID=940295 RepID=A0A0U3FJQ5_9CREN|nr:hypothetical protein [Ignicoccus islandicus]ALU12118.1 hypothetical protein EYM_00510 [Ignicoccus islandicus DSM 13165]